MKRHDYLVSWIETFFDTTTIRTVWKDEHHARLIDANNMSIVVEMRGNTLYVNGKPFGGIPSLLVED